MNMYSYKEQYQSQYGSLFGAYVEDPQKKGFIKVEPPVQTHVTEITFLYNNDTTQGAIISALDSEESITITWRSDSGWVFGETKNGSQGYIKTEILKEKVYGNSETQAEKRELYEDYKNTFNAFFDGDELIFTVSRYKGDRDHPAGYGLEIKDKVSGNSAVHSNLFNRPVMPINITDGSIIFSSGPGSPNYMLTDSIQIKENVGKEYKLHTFLVSYFSTDNILNKQQFTLGVPFKADYKKHTYIPDIPGQIHEAIGNITEGLLVRFDSNGDQTKDMLMTLRLKSVKTGDKNKKNNADRPNDVIVLTLKSYDTGETFEQEIRPHIFNEYLVADDFSLRHIQRSDGVLSNVWGLEGLFSDRGTEVSKPNFNLRISAPMREREKLNYNINFAGVKTVASFNAEKTVFEHTVKAAAFELGNNKMAMDFTLGAFNDKLRLILEPIQGSEEYSNIYAFMYINENEVAAAQTIGAGDSSPVPYGQLALKAKLPYSFKVMEVADKTDNTALRIDLNNDGQEDLVIYDRLLADTSRTGENANYARQHRVHLSGPGLNPNDAILTFAILNNEQIQTPQEATSEETFLKYLKFYLPSDFTENKKPGNVDAFKDTTESIANITLLRKDWKNQFKDKVPFTNKLDETWTNYVVKAYALLPLKKNTAIGSDSSYEAGYLKAINAFYKAFDEEITTTQKDHSLLWKLFKGFSLKEPEEESLQDVTKVSWNSIYEQMLYYAQRYADWAAKVMESLGEAANEHSEKEGNTNKTYSEIHEAAYAKGFSQRMKAFNKIKDKPGLQQVRTVHYPKNYMHEVPGRQPVRITHVPLDMYYWKEDDEWHVIDLTNPDDTYEQDLDVEAGQLLPPKELFAKLNKSGHFVEGIMVVEMPEGTYYEVQTEMQHDVGYYATYIAFALLAIGLILTGVGAPGGIAVAAGGIALAAADVAFIVSSVSTLNGLAARDKLTFTNVALEVGNIITAGAGALIRVPGKILSVASKSESLIFGSMVPLIKASKVSYLALHGTQKVGGGVIILALQMEAIEQLAALDGKGSKEDMLRAGQAIIYQLMAAGLMRSFHLSGEEALTAAQDGKNLMLLEVEGRPCFVPANPALAGLLKNLKEVEKLSAKTIRELLGKSEGEIAALNGKTVKEIEEIISKLFTINQKLTNKIFGNSKKYYIHANEVASVNISENGILTFDIRIPENLQRQGFSTEIFKDAVLFYTQKNIKVNGIFGKWLSIDIYEGGKSSNLITFTENYLYKNMTFEEAALNTPTGKIASRLGFKTVKKLDWEVLDLGGEKPAQIYWIEVIFK